MKLIYLALMLVALAQPCLAASNNSDDGKKHSIGINLGVGDVNTNISSESSENTFVGGISYGYQYDSTWTINTGIIYGNAIDCILICAGGGEKLQFRTLDYYSYIVNIKGSLPLNDRWSVYGKLGVNHYNSEFSGNNPADRRAGIYQVNLKDNGVGALVAAGFDFRAYNGFGLGLETTWLDMGNLSSTIFNVRISYMF